MIGVHYWDDWTFGSSTVTARVYVHGSLVFGWPDVALLKGDMWTVARINGTSLAVERVGETPQIEPNYDVPDFAHGPF